MAKINSFKSFTLVVSRSVSAENSFSEIKDEHEVDESADELDLVALVDGVTKSV